MELAKQIADKKHLTVITNSIETWINNAGIGVYGGVAEHDLSKIQFMLHVNIEALTILSSLYVRDYIDVDGTRLYDCEKRSCILCQ